MTMLAATFEFFAGRKERREGAYQPFIESKEELPHRISPRYTSPGGPRREGTVHCEKSFKNANIYLRQLLLFQQDLLQ